MQSRHSVTVVTVSFLKNHCYWLCPVTWSRRRIPDYYGTLSTFTTGVLKLHLHRLDQFKFFYEFAENPPAMKLLPDY